VYPFPQPAVWTCRVSTLPPPATELPCTLLSYSTPYSAALLFY
jgi:hypothetical protein